MSFIPAVERWRETVRAVIATQIDGNPLNKSLIDASGLTIYTVAGIYTPSFEEIVLATIQRESAGNANAVGDKGNSLGLMQLNYGAGTPQGMGFTGDKSRLFDGKTNITYGVKYLLYQLKRYKSDIVKALIAYGAGTYRLDTAGVPVGQWTLDRLMTILKTTEKAFVDLLLKKKAGLVPVS